MRTLFDLFQLGLILVFTATALPCTHSSLRAETLVPTYLRCEYRVNPLGIDTPVPRLSWQLESTARDERQTAYQVLVASSPERLQQDRGDLWDSGRVSSSETVTIEYAGTPLSSHQHCYWKVRVWNGEGQISSWSEPARWSMGLLKADDWQAEWIGYEADRADSGQSAAPMEGAKWIGFANDKALNAPAGFRLYTARPRLPDDIQVKEATLALWLTIACGS